MADYLNFVRSDGENIAFERHSGRGPGILWLGGFHSDMSGTKAEHLAAWAKTEDRAFLRFDYYGHGASSGDFAKGTISRWRDDALAVLDGLTDGPQILVGSSMGGWMATLLAHARPERIAAMVLIAPAPDFTEALMWASMPAEIRQEILDKGFWQYGEGEESYPITRALIEDGRNNLVLDKGLKLSGPVRILQGMADTSVPWAHAVRLAEKIEGDVTITLVKDGDHRMSTPRELALLTTTLETVLKEIA